LAQVSRLNLLKLAPGGHLGRFIIWTEDAFKQLDALYGSSVTASTVKPGYKLPQQLLANSDLQRIINSDEVQSKLRAPVKPHREFHLKKNPLTNTAAMIKLNPYAKTQKRQALLAQERAVARKAAVASKRQ
jgi:large subunit ribosomal protein L4e